jgi:hypothetical protein
VKVITPLFCPLQPIIGSLVSKNGKQWLGRVLILARSKTKKLREPDMENEAFTFGSLDFLDLENRFGLDNACAILRTLEQFEGISEIRVAELSYEDRLRNVMSVMKDNIRYQTRH